MISPVADRACALSAKLVQLKKLRLMQVKAKGRRSLQSADERAAHTRIGIIEIRIRGIRALFGAFALSAVAQPWLAHAVRIVATSPPGGSVNFLAQALAEDFGQTYGVPLVVEKKKDKKASTSSRCL